MEHTSPPSHAEVLAVLAKILRNADMSVLTRRMVYRDISAHFAFKKGQLQPYKPSLKKALAKFMERKFGATAHNNIDNNNNVQSANGYWATKQKGSPAAPSGLHIPSTHMTKLTSNASVGDTHSKRSRPNGANVENSGGYHTKANGIGVSNDSSYNSSVENASIRPSLAIVGASANNIRGNMAIGNGRVNVNGHRANGNGISNSLNRNIYATGNNNNVKAYGNGKSTGRVRTPSYDVEENASEDELQPPDSDGSDYDPDDDDDYDPEEEEEEEIEAIALASSPGKINGNGRGRRVSLKVFERASILAEPLAAFMGELVSSRQNVVKKVHGYVAEKNLRDPKDRFYVICDTMLKNLLSVDTFTTMSLNTLLNDLLYNPDEVGDIRYQKLIADFNSREIAEKIEREEQSKTKKGGGSKKRTRKNAKDGDNDNGKNGESKRKKSKTGIHTELYLSKELQQVCESGPRQRLSRMEAIRLVWVYVKRNSLHDKTAHRIKCDDKLRSVFGGVDSIKYVDVFRLVNKHLSKEAFP